MNKETLQEIADNTFGLVDPVLGKSDYRMGFERGLIKGAKWQHQQSVDFSNVNANNITTASTENKTLWKEMYSEEDMRNAIFTSFLLGVDRGNYSKELEDKLIEQFKKK